MARPYSNWSKLPDLKLNYDGGMHACLVKRQIWLRGKFVFCWCFEPSQLLELTSGLKFTIAATHKINVISKS